MSHKPSSPSILSSLTLADEVHIVTSFTAMRVAFVSSRAVVVRGARWRRSPTTRVMARGASASSSDEGAVVSTAGAFANDGGGTNWEAMWANGIAEGQAFDCRRTEPGFQAMLDRGEVAVGDGRALVPGCGRGYALASLARAGFSRVVGLEISATARDACEAQLEKEEIPSGSDIAVEVADFFEYDVEEGKRFDAAYDCTFLCAIDPNKRKEWADVYARVIKPGGLLVSLVFPCGDFEGGPPYALSPEIVKNLLAATGKFKEVSLARVPEELYARGRTEYLYVWRRL